MSAFGARINHLRRRQGHEHHRVGFVELFFVSSAPRQRTFRSHLVGLVGLAALAGVATWATPLLLSVGSTTVLVVVAVWEWWSVGRQASEPSAAVTP